MIYTVNDLILALMELESKGLGDNEIYVMQYAGGDDKPCYVLPVAPMMDGGAVILETRWV